MKGWFKTWLKVTGLAVGSMGIVFSIIWVVVKLAAIFGSGTVLIFLFLMGTAVLSTLIWLDERNSSEF